ncbi:MAG: DUF402 domain-containing protein [Microthrixaceae bacterium]
MNFLTLVPPGEQWWVCTWMWGNPTIDIELYVDIVHPPAWTSDSCLQVVDLDLDVIRYLDGRVILNDEDEFAEHSVSLSYPVSVSTSARAAATDLFAAVAEQRPPFAARPDRWVKAAAQLSKET